MSHYFENDEKVESKRHEVKYYLRDKELIFESDSGVFSKNAVDFGTRTLIDYLLDQPLEGCGLDLGCGIGVIGICLMLFKDVKVDMVDVNRRAIALTEGNSKRYNLPKTEIKESNICENVSKKDYDFVVTNPPIRAGKKVVYAFFEGAYSHLRRDGALFVVIQKKQGAPSAKDKLNEIFGNCEIVDRNKGYYLLKAVKKED